MACTFNEWQTPNGYAVGKPVRFKLKNQFNGVDTNILSLSRLYAQPCEKSDWFRFYVDGRVVVGYHSRIPVAEYPRPMVLGGYYKLNGRNIIIELSYTQNGVRWDNLFLEGSIQGDTIKFHHDRYGKRSHDIGHYTVSRGDDAPQCKSFVLYNGPFRLKQPDW
jgi:hypothetical protein